MPNIVINDLVTVLIFYAVFVLAYLSNIVLSIYQNVNLLSQNFDKKKFYQSILKCLIFMVGSLLLVLAIDFATFVFNKYGIIGNGAEDIATVLAMLVTIGTAILKYIKEAYDTFRTILEGVKE